MEAMVVVKEQVKECCLPIAGRRDDVGYETELRTIVQRLALGTSVDFRFNLSDEDKRTLMQGSRILVITSAVEGFGIVAVEANACGIPVVASTGVPQGAVRDGFNGLRYPFGDSSALAVQIVRLLQDDQLYDQLSRNALEHAARFKWSRVGAEFEQVVRSLAAQ